MASLQELRTRLISQARVQDSERIANETLDAFLQDAMTQHNPNYTYATLPMREVELVITLAWISVCLNRASVYVNTTDLKGATHPAGGYGHERGSPFGKNMEMVSFLQKRYQQLLNQLSTTDSSPSGQIVVGRIIRRGNTSAAEALPIKIAPIVPISLFITAIDATSVTLTWAYLVSAEVYAVSLWSSTSPIREEWNIDGLEGTPQVSSTATLVTAITNTDTKTVKVTGLIAGTTYYFLATLKTYNDRVSYSNELSASLSTPVIAPSHSIPVLTTLASLNLALNAAMTPFQVTASNSPTAYTFSPLPVGLVFDLNTGILSGTPTVAGVTAATITASNLSGVGNAAISISVA